MRECAVCGETSRLSIHHVLPRSQMGDDVWGNLVCLCGDGVTGCHGDVEHYRNGARRILGMHILSERRDTVDYLAMKLGTADRALYWIETRLCNAA